MDGAYLVEEQELKELVLEQACFLGNNIEMIIVSILEKKWMGPNDKNIISELRKLENRFKSYEIVKMRNDNLRREEYHNKVQI